MKLSEQTKRKLRKDGWDLEFVARTQPQGNMKFEESYILTGNGYTKVLHIYEFAEDVHTFWLSQITNQDDTIATVDILTARKDEIMKKINRSISEHQQRSESEQNRVDRNTAAYVAENLARFAHQIVQGGEVVKAIHARIYFTGWSLEEVERRVEEAKRYLETIGHKSTIYIAQQKEEWMSLFTRYEKQKSMGIRDGLAVPCDSLGGGISFHHDMLKDPRGTLIGRTSTGGVFSFNPFYTTNKRTMFSQVVLGQSGSGKSTYLKMLLEGMYKQGYMIRGFDKARDFYKLTRYHGGKMIDLSGSHGMINPLEVFATSTVGESTEIDELGSFSQHIDKVGNMIRFLQPSFNDIEISTFKLLLRQFYIQIGMVPPDHMANPSKLKITGLQPQQYPTMSQFYKWLMAVKLENVTHEQIRTVEKLRVAIEEMVKQYGRIFDGHTSLANMENEPIVFFDIDSIQGLGQKIFTCQMFTALTLIWDHAIKNGRRMRELIYQGKISIEDIRYLKVFIDECHNIVNPKNVFAIDYLTRFQREMRKFYAGVTYATQTPNELLPSSATSQAVDLVKSLFQLTQYKTFFNIETSAIGKLKEALGESLTDSEFEKLPELDRGEKLTVLSPKHTFHVFVNPTEAQLRRFDGGQ